MPNKAQIYLNAMGIDVWKQRKPNSEANISELATSWQELEQKIAVCRLCELSSTRKNTVFGAGNKQSDLLIIGEAPGATEDAQGKPFVGRAGMLLTSILAAVGFARDDVFITNILKCRPPNNRDPSLSEVECCTPYLLQQISLINPKLIVAVGRIAAHFLLNTTCSMGELRGKTHAYGPKQIPLLITYHPAYLLRSPREKTKAYIDWLAIKAKLAELISS
jgi:uracil-DNA glycosylase family 4